MDHANNPPSRLKLILLHMLIFSLALLYGCDRSSPSRSQSQPISSPAKESNHSAIDARVESELVSMLSGIWIEWQLRQSWDFLDTWSSAGQWQEAPENLLPMISAVDGDCRAFIAIDKTAYKILVGVNLDADSLAVAAKGDSNLEQIKSLLSELMVYEEIYSADEMGQSNSMYAAVTHDGTKIGLLSITHGTSSMTKGIVSIAIIDWKSAIEVTPKFARILENLKIKVVQKQAR